MSYIVFYRHLMPNALSVHVFHGQNRKAIHFLTEFDVVITTYQTVSSIWRKCKDSADDAKSIFSVLWHRIILDEGSYQVHLQR